MFTVHTTITNKPDTIKDFRKRDDAKAYFYGQMLKYDSLIKKSRNNNCEGEGKNLKLESDHVNIYLEKAQ